MFNHSLRKVVRRVSLRNIVSLGLLLLLISGLVIGARAWSRPGGKAVMPFLSGSTQPASIETVSVTLDRFRFAPGDVTRAAGPFRLQVANGSGAQALTLQLRRDDGGLVQEWKVESGAQAWSEVIDLNAGGYLLTVAENPACIFHITVQ